MKVFVSSTHQDLTAHRTVLLTTLHRMHVDVLAMEYFTADPRPPLQVCQAKVLEATLYLGVFGWRYGFIDKQSGMSLTEIEYRTALAASIPPMLYLASESVPVLPDAVERGPGAEKLQRLKDEMCEHHTVARFTTAEDLARLIAADLHRRAQDNSERPPHAVRGPVSIDGAVGHTINPADPYLLCHAVNRVADNTYEVRLYLDLYLTDDDADDLEGVRRVFETIDRVVYQLHESFPTPTIAMQNWREYFGVTLYVYGEFWVQATVLFRDPGRPPVVLQRYVNLSVPDAFEG